MFRVLAVLLVVLGTFTFVAIIVARHWLHPYLHARHMERLEEENRRIDEQMNRLVQVEFHRGSTSNRRTNKS